MSRARIIKPDKLIKLPDPHITPVSGRRGNCLLCRNYTDLTKTHILPQSVGNNGSFVANGFLTSCTSHTDIRPRRFPNGVHFRTLCANCNSSLGGEGDKELLSLFESVKKYVFRKVIKPSIAKFEIRPNVVIKAILINILSANDNGIPSYFDDEVREIVSGVKSLRETPLRIYYWPYFGKHLTVARDIAIFQNIGQDESPDILQIIKFKPLGFVVTKSVNFRNLPCLNNYITNHDSITTPFSLNIDWIDKNPHWPAHVAKNSLFFAGGSTSGFVATPTWRT